MDGRNPGLFQVPKRNVPNARMALSGSAQRTTKASIELSTAAKVQLFVTIVHA